jgi:hypothetical protein
MNKAEEKQWLDDFIGNVQNTLLDLEKITFLARLARKTMFLPGDMAEVGCYKAGICKMFATICPHKIIHAYDTFTGLPEDTHGHRKGDFTISSFVVEQHLENTNCKLHQGIFPKNAIDTEYSLVHLDVDTYKYTKLALEFLIPRTAVIVVDDYNWVGCPGVKQAIDELQLKIWVPTPHQAVVFGRQL